MQILSFLTAVWHIVSSPTITPHCFLPFCLTITPTGSQGASRLPPSDRLCGHHGSSILSKRRLGPCESFTIILSALSSALILLLLLPCSSTSSPLYSYSQMTEISQVKINPKSFYWTAECQICVHRA